jgi:hypothetical protein
VFLHAVSLKVMGILLNIVFHMLHTVRISILLRQTNKCIHCKFIFVLILPLHVSVVKLSSSGGTKDHRLPSALNSHMIAHLRNIQVNVV